jgi:hypothetical protein
MGFSYLRGDYILTSIFISHATADEKLAVELMDMLQTQFNLTRENFFLTSDEQLEAGGNWIEEIRKGMVNATVVMPLITSNFMESHFCLCELGAAWVNEQALVPIIFAPLNYSALAATPFRSWVQVITVSSKIDLLKLAEAMKVKGTGTFNSVRFDTRATKFIDNVLNPFVAEMNKKESITPAAMKELRERNIALTEAYNQVEDEIQKLKLENDALRKMKDATEVKALDYAGMDDWETFMEAVEKVKKEIKPLDRLTISVLYHDRKSSGRGFSSYGDNAALQALENQGFIEFGEGWEPCYGHPAIARADRALSKLEGFISLNKDNIEERFEEEYPDVRFGLAFTPFWEEMLGEKIQHSDS